MSLGPVPLKIRRVGERCTLNLSRAQMSSCWCGVVVRRGVLTQCRTKIADLISYGWTADLQLVPSHVGVPGNERADQKAKQRAKSTQPEVPLTLRRTKNIISTYIDKYTAMTQKMKSFGKPWETLAVVGPIPRHVDRAMGVACFRLTAG
ncbi:reverse transcriptase [Trichonephila clavipes]|nr:reverse transcriptase [Trichonephila clavipes]